MAIDIHDARAQAGLRRAGACAAATLAAVGARLAPGITTAQIDAWIREDTAARGARPSQLGFHGFPAAVCTSVDDVVCHGIPRADVVLRSGTIVNIDVTSELDGWHGDTSITFCIGAVDPLRRRVVEAARACLAAGIAVVRPGARLGDIGAAIMACARTHEVGVVEQFCGHGIGRHMHMSPQVSHVGRAGTGVRLRPGMAFTIEPMTTIGTPALAIDDDGWTVRTADGSPSAQFEHTVVVTDDGCEVLTRI